MSTRKLTPKEQQERAALVKKLGATSRGVREWDLGHDYSPPAPVTGPTHKNPPDGGYKTPGTGPSAPWGSGSNKVPSVHLTTDNGPDKGRDVTKTTSPIGPASAQEIASWQKTLIKAGFKLKADGILGPLTKSALVLYRVHGGFLPPKAQTAVKGLAAQSALTIDAWNQQNGPGAPKVYPPTGKGGGPPDTVPDTPTKTPTLTGAGQTTFKPLSLGGPPVAHVDPSLAKWGSFIDPRLAQFGKAVDPRLAQFGKNINPALADWGQKIDPSIVARYGATPLADSLATSGASPLAASLADKLAGLQYDAQIHDTQHAQAQQVLDTRQSLADVNNWFGQVQAHQAEATKADADIGAAGTAAQAHAGASIISSLGGDANLGTGVVAGQAKSDADTLAALAANENSYNADMRPILATERAGASEQETNFRAQQAATLGQQLNDLTGQRGAAVAANTEDITKYNNDLRQQQADRLLQIRQYNDSLRESALGHRLDIAGSNNALAANRNATRLSILGENNSLAQSRSAARLGILGSNNSLAQSREAARLGILGSNNDLTGNRIQTKLAIDQFNAGQAQQGFANKLAVGAANLSALEAGLKASATKSALLNKPVDLANALGAVYKTPAFGIDPKTGQINGKVSWSTVISALGGHLVAQGVVKGSPRYWQLLKAGVGGLKDNQGSSYHGPLGPYKL